MNLYCENVLGGSPRESRRAQLNVKIITIIFLCSDLWKNCSFVVRPFDGRFTVLGRLFFPRVTLRLLEIVADKWQLYKYLWLTKLYRLNEQIDWSEFDNPRKCPWHHTKGIIYAEYTGILNTVSIICATHWNYNPTMLLITEACSAAYYGKFIGKLSELYHGVSGEVYAVDGRTLYIKDFTYDGEAPGEFLFVI